MCINIYIYIYTYTNIKVNQLISMIHHGVVGIRTNTYIYICIYNYLQSERIPRYTLFCLGYSGYLLRFFILLATTFLFNTKL